MGNPHSDLAASSLSLTFGDTTWEVSPLTLGDLGYLLLWCQYAEYRALRTVDGVSEEELAACRKECSKKPVAIGSEDFQEISSGTPQGLLELAYLSLKHKHPGLTRDAIKHLPADQIREISQVAGELAVSNPDEDTQKKILEHRENLKSQGILR